MASEYKDIPHAEWYVLSNDSFMSDWGLAKGKINTVVVPCPSLEIAVKVASYARSRTDQKYVRINGTHPRKKPHVLYSLCLGWLKQIDNGWLKIS